MDLLILFNFWLEQVQMWIQKTSMKFDLIKSKKRTPLRNAAECGNIEIVQLLIEKGADVNSKDQYEIWFNLI